MAAAGVRAAALLAAAAVLQRPTNAVATLETCASVQTCTVRGASKTCDVRVERCPPCIFPKGSDFTCYEYDTETRATAQCPFITNSTNFIDCSSTENWTKWNTAAKASSMNETLRSSASGSGAGGGNSTAAGDSSTSVSATSSSTGSSSNVVLYAGIGVGVLVVLLVIAALWRRRKRQRDRRNTVHRHMARGSSKRVKTKHEEAFGGAGGAVAYNNALDTSKGGAYGSYHHRKLSDPVMMEDPSRGSDTAYMTAAPTELSVDGMLGEPPVTPVVLLDNGAFKTGKSVGKSNNNGGGFTSVNDLLTQDISIRCTTSANVFDEYLRMKQEMNYDDDAMSEVMSEMSDLDSDTMSLHKYSLESAQGVGGLPARHDGGLSITDSEFEEHMENRGESECYSEMSYNDEKYSFSEDDDMTSEFAQSRVGRSNTSNNSGGGNAPDREVEI